jgi:hypothetical protein
MGIMIKLSKPSNRGGIRCIISSSIKLTSLFTILLPFLLVVVIFFTATIIFLKIIQYLDMNQANLPTTVYHQVMIGP